jgi:hypothetical protein
MTMKSHKIVATDRRGAGWLQRCVRHSDKQNSKMKIEKHPAAIARDEWLNSEEGTRCTNPTTLLAPAEHRQYLENRITAAFAAGWAACEKHKSKRTAAMPNDPKLSHADGRVAPQAR